jgi:hypothetical protein
MDADFAGLFLSPWVLGLFGLCIGSFLNVVIHRLPLMLERGWKEESAEFLGVKLDAPAAPPLTLSTPRSRCPRAASDQLEAEPARGQLPGATRSLCLLQGTDPARYR